MNSVCENIKDQIADLLTGILLDSQVQELQQHLNECVTCRDYARALKNEDTLLTELFARIDTDMTSRQERALQAVNRSYVFKQTNSLLIRRIIMKSPITKIAAAAVIVAVLGIGIVEFLGTGGTSGVVWAEVAKNVEASPSVIFRARGTGSRDPNDDWPNAYRIFWRSAALDRADWYRNGQIHRTIYTNLDTKTLIGVLHDHKKYNKEAMSDERVQSARANKGWTDPQGLLNLALSLEHHALGQKTINGVLCEGIEATGPDGGTARVWVGVETGYPVLVEIESIDAGNVRHTGTLDQFRWNVDLLAEGIEPEIPADYEPL
jgi:hypothetical protein